jgi:hypothetical protein
LQGWCAGFHGKFILAYLSGVSACRPDGKLLSEEFRDQINAQRPEYFASLAMYITLRALGDPHAHVVLMLQKEPTS